MWPKKKKKKEKNGAVKRSFFCQPTTNFGHPAAALIRAIIDDLMAAHDHLITINIFQSIHVNTSNSPDKLSGFAEQNLDFLNVHRATLPMVLLESDSVQRRRNLQRKENRAKKRNSICSDWDASKSILSINAPQTSRKKGACTQVHEVYQNGPYVISQSAQQMQNLNWQCAHSFIIN